MTNLDDSPRDDALRAEARRLYLESPLTKAEIVASLGIPPFRLDKWKREENWPRRKGPYRPPPTPRPVIRSAQLTPLFPQPAAGESRSIAGEIFESAALPGEPDDGSPIDHESLIRRLYRALDQTLSQMERSMPDDPGEPERQSRALGNVVRSYEKVKELEAGTVRPESTAPKSGHAPVTLQEEDELRLRLVERILKLRERERAERGDRGPEA